ncbi:MAG: hypothetical protein D6727_10400 [Gammaproteobacteria bacterium]|nr:MAG: hypothetical protein D6727_10400 [Gammaproteobacteria bacterium]
MNMRSMVALAGVALIGVSLNAAAVDNPTGFYAGGGLGLAKADKTACDELDRTVSPTFSSQVNCDDQDVAWKLFVGWQPIKWAGIEAGFLDLGKLTAKGGATDVSAKVDGGFIAATFTVPMLEQVGFYGKGGVYIWDGELGGTISSIGPIPTIKDDDSSGFFGFGFRFPLGERFGMRLEYERYLDIGPPGSIPTPSGPFQFGAGQSDVDYFSVHGLFSF